jgi:hypothetical protein
MSEVDDLEQNLELARLGLSSTPAARARVHERLAARGAFAPAGTQTPPQPVLLRHGVPPLVSAMLMGAAFATGFWLRDVQVSEPRRAPPDNLDRAPLLAPATTEASAPRDPAPVASSPRSTPPDTTEPPPSAEPQPPHRRRHRSSEPPAPAREPRARSSPATAGNARAASGELALLRRAERAIRSGDPALALILLDQLERTYPKSELGEERRAARVLVECARSGELATPEARRFIEQHPSSVYTDRIVRACQLEARGSTESSTDVRWNGH